MMEIKIQLDNDIPFEKAARVLDTLNQLQIEHVREIQLDYEPSFALELTEARQVSEALHQILNGGEKQAVTEPLKETIEGLLQKIDKYLVKSTEGELVAD